MAMAAVWKFAPFKGFCIRLGRRIRPEPMHIMQFLPPCRLIERGTRLAMGPRQLPRAKHSCYGRGQAGGRKRMLHVVLCTIAGILHIFESTPRTFVDGYEKKGV